MVRLEDPLVLTLGTDFVVLCLLDTLGFAFDVRLDVLAIEERFDGALVEVLVRTLVGVLDILPCELSFLTGFFDATRIELSEVFLVRFVDDDVIARFLLPTLVEDLRTLSTRELFLLPEAMVAMRGVE